MIIQTILVVVSFIVCFVAASTFACFASAHGRYKQRYDMYDLLQEDFGLYVIMSFASFLLLVCCLVSSLIIFDDGGTLSFISAVSSGGFSFICTFSAANVRNRRVTFGG